MALIMDAFEAIVWQLTPTHMHNGGILVPHKDCVYRKRKLQRQKKDLLHLWIIRTAPLQHDTLKSHIEQSAMQTDRVLI